MKKRNWNKLGGRSYGTARTKLKTLPKDSETSPNAGRNRHIYGTQRWRQLSQRIRKQHPYCVECGARAEDGVKLYADHILEIADHPNLDPYDPSNIQVLCAHHHLKKTRAEERRRKAEGRDRQDHSTSRQRQTIKPNEDLFC